MAEPTGEQGQAKHPKGQMISFIALLVIVIAIGALAYLVMRSFILPMFLAALIVVIFRPVDRWIYQRCGGRRRLAALLTTGVVLLVVLVPTIWILTLGITEALYLATGDQLKDVGRKLDTLRARVGLAIPAQAQLNSLESAIESLTSGERLQFTEQRVEAIQAEVSQLQTQLQQLRDSPTTRSGLRARASDALAVIPELDEELAEIRQWLPATPDQPDDPEFLETRELESRDAVDRLSGRYRQVRFQLLGGMPWATVIELANPGEDQFRSWRKSFVMSARKWLLYLGGEAGEFVARFAIGLAVMVLSIYYFLVDGPEMIRTAMRLSPLDDAYEEELLTEFSSVSRAVVLATLLSAIVQGLLAAVAYLICGLPVFLLTVLTTILAMVPFVGAAAVWVPATIYLAFIADDRMGAAIFMGIWGLAVVSMADNLIKPLVLHGHSRLHPLLGLLSIIGGIQALGPVGLLVGPMVVSFLQALLNMLRKEIAAMDTT